MIIKIRELLTNQIVMVALLISAMLIPIGIAVLFDVALGPEDTLMMTAGTGCAMLVQMFWAVSTYLLLQEKWTLPVKLYAAFTAALFAGSVMAIVIAISRGLAMASSPGIVEFAIMGSFTLYFVLLCQIAERLAKTTGGTVGYALLTFYWPLSLFVFKDRLMAGFEQAAHSRDSHQR